MNTLGLPELCAKLAAAAEQDFSDAIVRAVIRAEGHPVRQSTLAKHGVILKHPSTGTRWFEWRGRRLVEQKPNQSGLVLGFITRELAA